MYRKLDKKYPTEVMERNYSMTILSTFASKIVSLRNDRRAVTALEYGLIASLIAVAIITSVTLVGTNMAAEFTSIAGKL
jgi:pilus assembly protein Flp/PilA